MKITSNGVLMQWGATWSATLRELLSATVSHLEMLPMPALFMSPHFPVFFFFLSTKTLYISSLSQPMSGSYSFRSPSKAIILVKAEIEAMFSEKMVPRHQILKPVPRRLVLSPN